MQKIFLLLTIVLMTACGNDTPSAPAKENPVTEKINSKDQNTDTDQSSPAKPQSTEELHALENRRRQAYGKLITGEWQAVADAGWKIKVEGNTIDQIKNDQLSSSEEFTIHVKCDQGGCFSEFFWCIATDSYCYIVRSVDTKYLNLQTPNSDEVTKFVKL